MTNLELDAWIAERKPYKCRKCGGTEFYVYKKSDDPRRYCPSCARKNRKKWRTENPDKVALANKRWSTVNPQSGISATKKWKLTHRYNMTVAEYDALVSSQEGKCAICGKVPDKRLSVDHCHKTGQIRGLICNQCNRGLGWFYDDISLLKSAIDYLGKHEAICLAAKEAKGGDAS